LLLQKGYYAKLFDYQSTSIPIKGATPELPVTKPRAASREQKMEFAFGPEKVGSVRLT
jgi:hypothetical protein